MSLIACGSIHEGYEWFSDDSRGRQDILCVWLLYYVSNFADSRMEVPRYRSSPTSWSDPKSRNHGTAENDPKS